MNFDLDVPAAFDFRLQPALPLKVARGMER